MQNPTSKVHRKKDRRNQAGFRHPNKQASTRALEAKKSKIQYPNSTLSAAFELQKALFSIIPIKTDGSKTSPVRWAKYQSEFATNTEILEWFDRPNPYGIGIIHGIISGGSEVIDVDAPELVEAFEKRLEEIAPGLLAKLIIVRTPRGDGGRHYYYNCDSSDFLRYDWKRGDDVEPAERGNQKLAEREIRLGDISEDDAKSAGARRKDDGRYYVVKTLIETRGEGGYTIAPGSPAKTHPTGKPYQLIQGEFAREGVAKARITFDERATLLEVAHSFNEYINPKKVISIPRTAKREEGDIKPGEAFDQSPDAFSKTLAILEKHGWRHHSNDKHGSLLTRPGKSSGISARLFDSGVFYAFSSNAQPFDPEQAYTPFGVLIELEYNGDASACARALSAEGFGERPKSKAADNSTELLDGKLSLTAEPAERGKIKLSARGIDGNVIHRDVINLDSAKDRDAFIKALKLSGDEESKTVQSALLAIDVNSIVTLDAAKVSAAEERTISKTLSDGRILEQIAGGKFAVFDPMTDTFTYADKVEDGGIIYEPAEDTGVSFLPEKLTDYGTEAELDARIEQVYRRYCDAPDAEMKKAVKYVRMSYIVDFLNELPYLKVVGEPGSGKSRFCAVGALMAYRPLIAASVTGAVLFRLMDRFKPTLFIDEFNVQAQGEDVEAIMQVLNTGFQRLTKVPRTGEPDAHGERKIEFFSTFGAKFLAGLKSSGSEALESRCVEVRLVKTSRTDIPFQTTDEMLKECAETAEMLYLWRLRFLSKGKEAFRPVLRAAEEDLKRYQVDPRFIQISTPLYALIEDEQLKKEFVDSLEKRTQTTRGEKLDTFDGKLVRTVYEIVYDDSEGKVKQRRPYEVDEPIYEATIVDIKNALIGEYPELKDGYIGKKLGELGFSKAPLTKNSYNGKKNDKKNRSAVIFEPETLKKIFVNYGLPLPGESVPTQGTLIELEEQIPFNLEEHPEPERLKKGR